MAILFRLTLDIAAQIENGFPPETTGELYPVVNGQFRHGAVSSSGSLVIPCQYEALGPFLDGLAFFRKDGLMGYINVQNRVVIPAIFEQAGCFSEGLAVAQERRGEILVINTLGQTVFDGRFDELSTYSEGMARFRKGDKYGFVNRNGEVVIPAAFAEVTRFSEGLAVAQLPDSEALGFIDKTGEVVVTLRFSDASPLKEGRALVYDKRVPSDIGLPSAFFVDRDGNVVAGPFMVAKEFSEGLALVTERKKRKKISYFIGRDGRSALTVADGCPVSSFSQGLAVAMRDVSLFGLFQRKCMFGFVDKDGKWVIEPKYDSAQAFEHGLARVALDGQEFLINRTGQRVWKLFIPARRSP